MYPSCSVRDLFSGVPVDLPPELKQRPYCTEIAELALSMATMDHLDPIMYRGNFRRNPHLGERGLRKVRRRVGVVEGGVGEGRGGSERSPRGRGRWVWFKRSVIVVVVVVVAGVDQHGQQGTGGGTDL